MPKDILLDENLDLLIVDGDFVVGESTAQHQKILMLADKGEFKESPMRGVGALRFLEEARPDNLLREIRQEFTIDGMLIEGIKIDSLSGIQIEANYIE